jgi:heterodisulfide reductase subunit C
VVDFGYTINPDRQIDYDSNDRRIVTWLLSREPSVKICIACGSCTATCTAGGFTDFNIRKVQLLLRRGEIQTLKAEVEKCMLCGKCQLVCPRGVNLRNMIHSIHNAVEIFGI